MARFTVIPTSVESNEGFFPAAKAEEGSILVARIRQGGQPSALQPSSRRAMWEISEPLLIPQGRDLGQSGMESCIDSPPLSLEATRIKKLLQRVKLKDPLLSQLVVLGQAQANGARNRKGIMSCQTTIILEGSPAKAQEVGNERCLRASKQALGAPERGRYAKCCFKRALVQKLRRRAPQTVS